MAASVVVDASFLIALLGRRETNHVWADEQARRYPPPWQTCEAAITEAFFLLGADQMSSLSALLRRRSVTASFRLEDNAEAVLTLMQKYASIPMSFADACLVRMTEVLPDPLLLTTDTDFRVYRRHSRQVVPSVMPD